MTKNELKKLIQECVNEVMSEMDQVAPSTPTSPAPAAPAPAAPAPTPTAKPGVGRQDLYDLLNQIKKDPKYTSKLAQLQAIQKILGGSSADGNKTIDYNKGN